MRRTVRDLDGELQVGAVGYMCNVVVLLSDRQYIAARHLAGRVLGDGEDDWLTTRTAKLGQQSRFQGLDKHRCRF